ncbi:MAG: site-2 protease family protein [Phycisphaeraceae bacterium]
MDFFPYLTSAPALLLMALGFGFIIFVHELGHFLVAKAVGIKVTQFAIGFGPALLAWRKGIGFRGGSTEPEYEKMLKDAKAAQPDIAHLPGVAGVGETEYRLNYLPLGGYVKMLGQEDMDATATSDDPRSFNRKPVWARAAVVSAGVIMNLIFAVLFFIIAFMYGVSFPPALVGGVVPGTPAATTYAAGHGQDPAYLGLKGGDHVVSIDGERTNDFTEIMMAAALGHGDVPIQLTIQRQGLPQPLTYNIKPIHSKVTNLLGLGIRQPASTRLAESDVYNLSPDLLKAGVEKGTRIIAVDGKPVTHFHEVESKVIDAKGRPVELTFKGDKEHTVQVKVHAWPGLTTSGNGTEANLLGLVPTTIVTAVSPNSPAEAAGVQVLDILAAINNTPWPSPQQTVETIVASADRPIALSVLRGGEIVELKPVKPGADRKLGIGTLPAVDQNRVGKTLPQSPLAQQHRELPAGSRILAINDEPVERFGDVQRILGEIAAAQGDASVPVSLKLTYQLAIKGEPTHSAQVTLPPAEAATLAKAQWDLPMALQIGFETLREPIKANDPVGAAHLGLIKTKQFMTQTYLTLLRLFQRTVPVNELRGPIGIFQAGTVITRDNGWPYLLFFLGVISVNLAVINFLPLPIVDGGLMVFLIIEKIKGSPVNPKVMAAVNYVGLAMFVSLFLMVTYFDLVRP